MSRARDNLSFSLSFSLLIAAIDRRDSRRDITASTRIGDAGRSIYDVIERRGKGGSGGREENLSREIVGKWRDNNAGERGHATSIIAERVTFHQSITTLSLFFAQTYVKTHYLYIAL